ncbi:MAG TPA: hypothetical protein ENH10_01830 [Bacteroidetes bacterium]|nr:hypothetical protein [Bacteroidota bacterium]HEX03882.1 hypothetical protein [Bacteroidota bacterium]
MIEPGHGDPGPMVVIAGQASLQGLSIETLNWKKPVGVGLGANWIIENVPDRLAIINSISHTLQLYESNGSFYQPSQAIDLGLQRNTNPYAAAVVSKGVAVTNLLANTVSIVDLDSARIVDEWPVGVAPEGILAYRDTLYVINTGYDFDNYSFNYGSVFKMDSDDGEILDYASLGMNPQFGAIVGDELHIVCTGNYTTVDGEIWILDLHDLHLKDILAIGHSPGRIVVDYYSQEGSTAWIAAGGWSNEGEIAGLILSYNTVTREIHDPLFASLGVVDVAVDYTSGRLYAICRDAMKLDVFEGGERIASYDLVDPPNAISIIY